LRRQEATVLVMAVAAGNQTFVHPMVEWPRKQRFHIEVAAVTKLRLRILEEPSFLFRLVNRVAVEAAHIVLHVLGTHEVAVLFTELVTIKTAAAGIRRFHVFESDDFRNIATAIDVGLSRTVTRFATLPFHTALLFKHCFPMRPLVVTLVLLTVARRAYVTPNVKRGIGWPVRGYGLRRLRFRFASGRRSTDSDGYNYPKQKTGSSTKRGNDPVHSSSLQKFPHYMNNWHE
jgi:hypothetical protein